MLKESQIYSDALDRREDKLYESSYLNEQLGEIGSYKDYWEQQKRMLRMYHEASESGTGLVQMQAEVMDKLLRRLWKNTKANYFRRHEKEWTYSISLVALGGYGRGELSPHSDVDIMLLYGEKVPSSLLTDFLDIFNEEVIHPLWDLKMRVRHTHRTINESITDAKRDFRTKNAQQEARLIYGSKELFEAFQERYEAFLRSESIDDFMEQCLEDKRMRHKKCDYTVFLQEPDIKTGVGGLYDYFTILWMGRARLKVATMDALEHQGLLTSAECVKLKDAYNFLLKVRNELHFSNDNGSNLLNLESQEQVAVSLGYKGIGMFARGEAFMRDYYREAGSIYEISKRFEERLNQLGEKSKKNFWLKAIFRGNLTTIRNGGQEKYIDGFVVANNRLTYESTMVFYDDPARLVRVFRHAQQYHVEFDANLKSLIKESTHLMNEELVNDLSANRSFCSIFQAVGEVYPILALMHELGVLQNFLPEFKNITHLVQHEHYHRYTVDIHTLAAIEALDDVFRFKNTKGKRYYDAIKSTTRPWLLYLMLLLHDLGKATGASDSATAGVAIAKPILDRLQIDPTQQEYVLFVIKNNLQMMNFWQRFDIDDPQAARTFALFVGDTEVLNYFYVQTYCDLTATSSGVWNSHKEMLHTKLFEKTLEFLIKNEGHIEQRIKHKKDLYRESIYKYYPRITQDKVDKMLGLYPDNYFVLNSPEEFDIHIRLLDKANEHIDKSSCSGSLMPIIHWEYDVDRCLTVVNIVTWDRTGFLAKLAGAFAACGFNILGEKGFTRSDQMNIKVFHIMESYNNNASNGRLREEFYQTLKEILVNDADPMPRIALQLKKHHKNMRLTKNGLRPMPKTMPRVNIHHDFSNKKTVIEIHCSDQAGLLYQFARTITRHGFNIIFSRLSAEFGDAVNIFHVQKNNVDETTTTKDLIELREAFNRIVESRK